MSVDKLTRKDSPELETVKMQIAIIQAREELVKANLQMEDNRKYRTTKLLEEIVSKKNEAEVFGDIVMFVLIQTSAIDQTQNTEVIEKETMTALESV